MKLLRSSPFHQARWVGAAFLAALCTFAGGCDQPAHDANAPRMVPQSTRLPYRCVEINGELIAEIPMGKYVLTVSCQAVNRSGPYKDLRGYHVGLEYFWVGSKLVEFHAPHRARIHPNAQYIQFSFSVAHDPHGWPIPVLDLRNARQLGAVDPLGLKVYQQPATDGLQYLVFERAWDATGRPFTLMCELGWFLDSLGSDFEPTLPQPSKPGCFGSFLLHSDVRISIVRHPYLGPKQYLELREDLLSRVTLTHPREATTMPSMFSTPRAP